MHNSFLLKRLGSHSGMDRLHLRWGSWMRLPLKRDGVWGVCIIRCALETVEKHKRNTSTWQNTEYDHREKGTGDLVGSDGSGWGTVRSAGNPHQVTTCLGGNSGWDPMGLCTFTKHLDCGTHCGSEGNISMWMLGRVVTVESRNAGCFPLRRMGSGCQNGPQWCTAWLIVIVFLGESC